MSEAVGEFYRRDLRKGRTYRMYVLGEWRDVKILKTGDKFHLVELPGYGRHELHEGSYFTMDDPTKRGEDPLGS